MRPDCGRTTPHPRWAAVFCIVLLAACDQVRSGGESNGGGPELSPPAPAADSIHELAFVFVEPMGDVVSPWLIEARTRGADVERSARAWILSGSEQVPILDQRWTTPYTRAAGRLLPWNALRLIVGSGGEPESIIAMADTAMELEVLAILAEGSGGGARFRLFRARFRGVGPDPRPGVILEHTRARPSEAERPADWLFVTTEDGTMAVLQLPRADAGSLGQVWAVVQGEPFAGPALAARVIATRTEEGETESIRFSSENGALDGELVVLTGAASVPERNEAGAPGLAAFGVSGTLDSGSGASPARGAVIQGRE